MSQTCDGHLSGHSLEAVERYIEDYKRVLLLLERGFTVEEITRLIGRGRSVVVQYVELAHQFHPHLEKA